jgi:endonuclease YncB( thermonuclease family)
LILLAAVALSSCDRRPKPPPVADVPTAVRPHVVVLAADTLVIDGKHVKLSNAFGPMPVPDARCWAEALAAKQAVRTVAAMMDRAATVQVHPTGQVDDFNRTLAKVDVDGADLGELLYREGIAARATGKRFEWCDPVSRNEPGAPNVLTMMELTPGPAPGQ